MSPFLVYFALFEGGMRVAAMHICNHQILLSGMVLIYNFVHHLFL
ncbi:hypothetical protein CLOSTHATH_02451 [Hungatella hathewayi DSM 13479]|uniref:Uncharacterized protein n=1 Tax=Hungatella hathewayi DSM 13479 TaxID=566550 RepID=D3AFR6_9FIRM|nr:hypothetical protein CLOSTHATH_02451 [Hungatella hathewayi DSM 13479]